MLGGANIGIVIAGDHRNAIRCTNTFQPGPRRRKLRVQRQVDEVAGDRDLVRRLRLKVRHQRIEHIAPVEFVPIAGPVEIAERALSREIAQPLRGHRRQCGSDRWASVNAAITSVRFGCLRNGAAARSSRDTL